MIARICGGEKIIVYSHNAGTDKKIYSFVCKLCIRPLTCFKKVAEYMFTADTIQRGDYRIINNGVEIEKFRFNSVVREKYRKKSELIPLLFFMLLDKYNNKGGGCFENKYVCTVRYSCRKMEVGGICTN